MGFLSVDKYIQFLYGIGFFGEFIMIFLVVSLIWGQTGSLIFFFIGYILNVLINIVLKRLLREPRPIDPIAYLASEKGSMKGAKYYGMPSGHSQNVFYCISYLLNCIPRNIDWVLLSFMIGLITIWERYIFHNHTVMQLLVGAILGFVFGWIVYIIGVNIRKEYHIPF